MNVPFKHLLIASAISTLVACGGGGGGDDSTTGTTGGTGGGTTTQTVSMKLSGLVYDEELANAEVTVYVGNDLTNPVGTGVTDENGNYDVDVSVSEDDANQACVIRAVRGDFSLETLPGSINTVAAAAVAGEVSSDSLPGINVTNVSTAQLAVIRATYSGSVPNDQTSIDAAEDAIEADATVQQQILELAAAIKVVIDSGVALPDGSTDTVDLINDILDGSNTTFLSANQAEIDAAEAEIQSDPVLATQLIAPPITAADLTGNKYAVGQDTMVSLEAGGVFKGYDFWSVVAGAAVDNGTWSLDETTQVLTVNIAATATDPAAQVVVTIDGGNPNVMTGTVVVDGVSEGLQTFRKVVDASTLTLPMIGFDVADGKALEFPATCTGSETGWAHSPFGEIDFSCNTFNGMFVLTPTVVGGINVTGYQPMVVIPLTGSETGSNVMNYAMWEYPIDPTTGAQDASNDPVTTYGKSRIPVDKALPTAGSVALRIDVDGTPSVRVAHTDTSVTIYKMDLTTDTGKAINKTLSLIPPTDPNNPFTFTAMSSVNTNTGVASIGFALPGGTIDPVTSEKVVSYGAYINDVTGASKTRIQYPLQPITESDVSGKTFAITDLVFDVSDAETVTFDAVAAGVSPNTGSVVLFDGGSETFTWEIDATSGTLTMRMPWTDGEWSGTDLLTLYKGYVDMGAGSMIVGGWGHDEIETADIWVDALVLTQQ